MKAIMVMFDSLNRELLSAYGCEETYTPNFKRLQKHTATFDQCYVGSMPCMPARRELHTGRYNFLHRSWGPLEPYDDSMPQILKDNGIVSHLISDHQHYWEDGGCTYHSRYSSWEISRGQEGDTWKCVVDFPLKKDDAFHSPGGGLFDRMHRQDQINRTYMDTLDKTSQGQTFGKGIEFLDVNHQSDNWFLQIETFDPHEPFYSLEEFKKLYPDAYDGDNADWPPYYFVREDDSVIAHTRREYKALLSMCDYFLGKVLDKMDEYDLWKDTMLIVNTDHGYLLGEHGWWSKTVMPLYNEIAHTPLFIWDPRTQIQDERRNALVQTIDLAPTILDFFQLPIPKDMEGKPLKETIRNDHEVRRYAYYGYHGGHINVCDKEHVYMRSPFARTGKPYYEYTLMPTHMRQMFTVKELQNITLQEPFSFTKGCRTMKIEASDGMVNAYNYGDKLYDLKQDPKQENECDHTLLEASMINAIRDFMLANDAPIELYERYGISKEEAITVDKVQLQKEEQQRLDALDILKTHTWTKGARNGMYALLQVSGEALSDIIKQQFETYIIEAKTSVIEAAHVITFIKKQMAKEQQDMLLYFVELSCRVS